MRTDERCGFPFAYRQALLVNYKTHVYNRLETKLNDLISIIASKLGATDQARLLKLGATHPSKWVQFLVGRLAHEDWWDFGVDCHRQMLEW